MENNKRGKSLRIRLKKLFYIDNHGLKINCEILKKLGVSEEILLEKLKKGEFKVV